MRSSCSPAFPLRKTLLALTVGAITHSAAAVENDAGERQKNEETMVAQATPDSRFRAGGDLVVPAYLDGQVANGSANKTRWTFRSALSAIPRS